MKYEEACSEQGTGIVIYFKPCSGYDDEVVRSLNSQIIRIESLDHCFHHQMGLQIQKNLKNCVCYI